MHILFIVFRAIQLGFDYRKFCSQLLLFLRVLGQHGMVTIRIQQVACKILIQLFDNLFQHSQSLVDFRLFRYQLVRFYMLCRFLANALQQFSAFHSSSNIPDPFQHFRIQSIIINIVVLLTLFGVAVMVCAAD